MCLVVVASHLHPDSPLLVAAHRDEQLPRPAVPLEVLQSTDPRILGGRDLEAGGTWLAVNQHGVVATLTNRPAPAAGRDRTKRSRGELPLALARARRARDAVEAAMGIDPSRYNPAWMLVADASSVYAVDLTGREATVGELGPGLHVLENRPFGAPSPKVDHVKELLTDLPTWRHDPLVALGHTLANHDIAEPDGPRPEVSAACVHSNAGYGTRWSGLVDARSAPPRFLYTDGAPCRTPLTDAAPLWQEVVTSR